MSSSGIRSERHRSTPIREGVVCRCKYAIFGAPPRMKIADNNLELCCQRHLKRIIVGSNSEFFNFDGSVIPQIPIGRCLR